MLIILDLHNADNYYHVFSYPTYGYVSSFGKRGDLSGEISAAQSFRYCSNDSVWALDTGKDNLVRFRFTPLTNSFTEVEKVELAELSLGKLLDFVVYNDSTFIIPDFSGKSRLFYIVDGSQAELTCRTGKIYSKKGYTKSSRPALAQIWRSFIDYNPRNGILVLATQLGEVIEIYDLVKGSYVMLVGEQGEPQFMMHDEGYAVPTGIMGFLDVQVTDNYIYALFQGTSLNELAQNLRSGKKNDGGKLIYVFSLSGEPVCKYKLDYPISAIHVDETERKIIAIETNKKQHFLEFIF